MEKQQKNINPPPYGIVESDPSSLTTQQLWREIASLKELLQQRVEAVEDGIAVAHKDKERVPTEIQSAVGSAQVLVDTKIYYEHKLAKMRFEFIEKQLNWMEILRVEQKHDLKELANKNEIAASKQVDQLAELVNRGLGNLNDKIGDLKNSDSTSKGKTIGIAQVISVVVAVATIVGIIVGMVMKYLAATGK